MDYRDRIREIINHATGCQENWCQDDRRAVALVDEMADELDRLRKELRDAQQNVGGYERHTETDQPAAI